ncbi:MAG: hypothetical protein KDD42_05615, partial [Bdellovibrionales bacterium]|nr:hypothetical protein [Bdellovibrionales bacterium]
MEDSGQILHTEGAVSDYFTIESHLLSTRSSDGYKAIDRARNVSVGLWVMRHPLAVSSESVRRYLERMHRIAAVTPIISEMRAYGVDSGGTAFSVFPPFDGSPISTAQLDVAETERRFMSCLQYVDRLHQAGIVCGDLCGASFLVTRTGEVKFVGLMGSFDSEAAATSMLPPNDTLPYISPEQRSGAAIEPASDVFALGVLGYRLFTGQFPYGEGASLLMSRFELDAVKPVSQLIASPPVWGNEILLRSLDPSPQNRYQSVGEMLQAVASVRKRALDQESAPVQTNRDLISTGGLQEHKQISVAIQRPVENATDKIRRNTLRGIFFGLMVTVIALIVLKSNDSSAPVEPLLSTGVESHLSALGSEELKHAVEVIAKPSSQEVLAEKRNQLDKIVNSDDPLAHDILVKSAREADSRELRELAEKAIVDRARRLGLMRSAEQVRQWLRRLKQDQLPPSYEPILKSLDTTLPVEAVSASLRRAYADQPELVLRLAVALALDSNQLEAFQPVIAQLVGDAMKFEDAAQYSAISLILANPDLAVVFGEDVIQKRTEIPDADLLWLLKLLADRNDINVRAIASQAVERGILPPIRAQFLQLIRDRSDLPPDVLHALLRAAAGALSVDDIASFGRWFDLETERVLLAVLADAPDDRVRLEAFDTLAGRSLSIEPSASLVKWVRREYWDKRGSFARAVGVIANLDKVDQVAVTDMFDSLDRFARDT